ncbi:hypothetical protein MTO96_023809 [Rhipicephalus appendiculatus]
MDPVELRIEVPYGSLAAKAWGPADGKRDFAGHGDSSHRPPGCRYNILEYVIDVRRAVDHLQWDRFCLVGHSMGGTAALMFAGLFPDRVLSLVTLDVVVPTVIVDSYIGSVIAHGINKFLKLEPLAKNPSPVYSMDDLLERLESASPGQLSEKSKKVLLSRGTRPVDCGLVLKRDIRAKTGKTFIVPLETQKAILSRYKGEMLIFRATDGASGSTTQGLGGRFYEVV